MANRRDGRETQEQVLEAALEVFARKGYRETKVAEICRKAGANVAAVNYHFGGKEQLYAEVWKRAFAEAQERLPVDGGLPSTASAKQRLRAMIAAMFSRILREGVQSRSGRLLLQEMAQPSEVLHEVMLEATKPVRRQVRGIVAAKRDDGSIREGERLLVEALIQRMDPGKELCAPQRAGEERQMCPLCEELGVCLRQFLENGRTIVSEESR